VIRTLTQHEPQSLPPGLLRRLRSVSLTCAEMDDRGNVQIDSQASSLERAILTSNLFQGLIRQRWAEISASSGQAITLWRGLCLVVLNDDRRRRSQRARTLWVVPLIGHEITASEQLRAICDQQRLDFQATVRLADASSWVPMGQESRLAAAAMALYRDFVANEKSQGEIQSLSLELSHSYEELSLLYRLSSGMTIERPSADFLKDACIDLQTVSQLRWLALYLVNDDPRLDDLAGGLFWSGELPLPIADLKTGGIELMQYLVPGQEAVLVHEENESLCDVVQSMGEDLLAVPLGDEKSMIGVLFGSDKLSGVQISSVDSKLFGSLASTISIYLTNTILFAETQSMFLGALRALTAAIDAKDSYTHGHSERVALLSRMLAEAAGIDEEACERVHLSGLVHDVGKIGVPESVLCKPGKLSDEEFAEIRKHPEIGARIIGDIPQMADLIPGVLCHHERWDGRGYPNRHAGKDIPLFGRLIGLADAFDAMSSDRAYRHRLDRSEVLSEILRCRGAQFDPELADLFVSLDFAPFDRMIEEHETLNAAGPATVIWESSDKEAS